MITRIRFDDVLWQTGNEKLQGKELSRFQMHIDWSRDLGVTLAPNIIVTELMKFPEAIEYLNNQMDADGGFTVDLHGWDHGPYAPRSYDEISTHLDDSLAWMDTNMHGHFPCRWVTPHGATSRAIQKAAREHGLDVETTQDPVIDQREADKLLRVTRDVSKLDDKIIMVHWWERGMALYRIANILKYGDVTKAVLATSEELDKEAHSACWGKGWEKR